MNWATIETALFQRRHWSWTVGAFVGIAAVGVIDYVTGPRITFSLFYLVPVAVAAWLSETVIAVAASALAAVVWLCAEVGTSRVDSSMLVYAWNFCTRLLFLLLVALLLSRLHQMLTRERDLSRTDALTGLLNARAFREVADAEMARAKRYAQPLSLAFIDIDDFKHLNDSRGHGAGDRLLKCVGGAIRANLRSSDVVARQGGDEFVVLLPLSGEEAARATVEKLGARVSEATVQEEWPFTLSIGVITCKPGEPAGTVDAVLEAADCLMYEAKSSGKGVTRFGTYGRNRRRS